jgi:PAS domain-containing protein
MKGIKKTHQNSITKDIMLKADLILDSISDGISIQDTGYKILYQNKFVRDTFGDSVGEFCYRVYEGNDSICEQCPLAKVFKKDGTYTSERRVYINDKLLHFESKAWPLKDSSGKIIAGIEVVRDINERKKSTSTENYAPSICESNDGLSV